MQGKEREGNAGKSQTYENGRVRLKSAHVSADSNRAEIADIFRISGYMKGAGFSH